MVLQDLAHREQGIPWQKYCNHMAVEIMQIRFVIDEVLNYLLGGSATKSRGIHQRMLRATREDARNGPRAITPGTCGFPGSYGAAPA